MGQFNPIFFASGKSLISPGNTNLVAYYNLDSNTNDQTGLSPNGTPTGIDYVAGKTGNAARFNANGDIIDIADSTNLSFTNGSGIDTPFSINVWVYFTSFSSTGGWILNKRTATSGGDEYQLVFNSQANALFFTKFDRTSNSIAQTMQTIGSVASLNTWYMVTVTDDGSKTFAGMKMYINASLRPVTDTSAGTYTGMNNGSAIFRLGNSAWAAPTAPLQFLGYLEDVGIWKNKVLSQGDISYLYNYGNGKTYPF